MSLNFMFIHFQKNENLTNDVRFFFHIFCEKFTTTNHLLLPPLPPLPAFYLKQFTKFFFKVFFFYYIILIISLSNLKMFVSLAETAHIKKYFGSLISTATLTETHMPIIIEMIVSTFAETHVSIVIISF